MTYLRKLIMKYLRQRGWESDADDWWTHPSRPGSRSALSAAFIIEAELQTGGSVPT